MAIKEELNNKQHQLVRNHRYGDHLKWSQFNAAFIDERTLL